MALMGFMTGVCFCAAWYEIVLTDKTGPPGREATTLAYRLEVPLSSKSGITLPSLYIPGQHVSHGRATGRKACRRI